jgi:hypothetical protein
MRSMAARQTLSVTMQRSRTDRPLLQRGNGAAVPNGSVSKHAARSASFPYLPLF